MCQTLCKTADGKSRVAAPKFSSPPRRFATFIREGKTHQIYSSMQAGAQFGMQTLDQNLAELVRARRITFEEGVENCHQMEDFLRLTGRSR